MQVCEELTSAIDGHTKGIPYRTAGGGMYNAGMSSQRALVKTWDKFIESA